MRRATAPKNDAVHTTNPRRRTLLMPPPSVRPVILFSSLLFTGILLADAPQGYALVWSDEFDGGALDTTKWGYRQLGARRDAMNTADAVTVGNGALTITTYTEGGVNYTGMISTQGTFLRTYGYYEASMDFNGSAGMWSAFWLQSPTMGTPVGSPTTAGTEMDVVEFLSHPNSGKNVNSAVHWDGYGASHQAASNKLNNPSLFTGFHTYGLLWTATEMTYFIDGAAVWNGGSAPISQRSEYIILSSEVDDTSTTWAGAIPTGGYGDRWTSTTNMQVDYVRVYAVPEPATCGATGAAVLGAVALRRRRRRRA